MAYNFVLQCSSLFILLLFAELLCVGAVFTRWNYVFSNVLVAHELLQQRVPWYPASNPHLLAYFAFLRFCATEFSLTWPGCGANGYMQGFGTTYKRPAFNVFFDSFFFIREKLVCVFVRLRQLPLSLQYYVVRGSIYSLFLLHM